MTDRLNIDLTDGEALAFARAGIEGLREHYVGSKPDRYLAACIAHLDTLRPRRPGPSPEAQAATARRNDRLWRLRQELYPHPALAEQAAKEIARKLSFYAERKFRHHAASDQRPVIEPDGTFFDILNDGGKVLSAKTIANIFAERRSSNPAIRTG